MLKSKSSDKLVLPFMFTFPTSTVSILLFNVLIAPPLTLNALAFDISAFGPNTNVELFNDN